MNAEKKDIRKSNYELLRIVAMVMIIAHHLALHTEWSLNVGETVSLDYLWIRFILMGGKLGVNIFVLISGYFLSQKSRITIKKTFSLWTTILFYSVACYFVGICIGTVKFSIFGLVKCFAPVTTVGWWYATTYFVLFLLSPYINILVSHLEKKEYRGILLLMLIIWSIIPTITNYTWENNDLTWFVFVYLIGGYIRKFGLFENLSTGKNVVGAIVAVLMEFVVATIFDFFSLSGLIYGVSNRNYFYEMNHITALCTSVMIFLCFSRINIKNNRIINCIAITTFGIYLLHDNQCIQHYLWNDIICAMRFDDSALLIPYSLAVVLIIFMCCGMIEFVRKKIFDFVLVKRDD